MKIAFERTQFLNYIWKMMQDELPPTHNINKGRYKTMSSYWKSLNFFNQHTKMNRIHELKKVFSKYVISFGQYLKEKKSIERILIFDIVNRDNSKNKLENYDDIKEIHLWSKKVKNIIKKSLDQVFLGAETIIFLEFKNAPKRNEYLDKRGFIYNKLKQSW